jgi:hypothetical protein
MWMGVADPAELSTEMAFSETVELPLSLCSCSSVSTGFVALCGRFNAGLRHSCSWASASKSTKTSATRMDAIASRDFQSSFNRSTVAGKDDELSARVVCTLKQVVRKGYFLKYEELGREWALRRTYISSFNAYTVKWKHHNSQ